MTQSNTSLRHAIIGAYCLYAAAAVYIGKECWFLRRYWRFVIEEHGAHFAVLSAVLIGNLTCAFYLLFRLLSLRETGRKLLHFEKQLLTGDSAAEELAGRLQERNESF